MIYYVYVIIPLIYFVLNAVIQILIARNIRKLGLLKSVIAAFSIGFALLVITEVIVSCSSLSALANMIIYIALGYCYFHFINLGETARRIRILTELYDEPDGITKEQLIKRYSCKDIINIRLSRLTDNHQIIFRDNRYYIKNQVLFFISIAVILLKVVILGRKSELYKKNFIN
jgi:hypothetical protein